jgi:exonuclease SbcC
MQILSIQLKNIKSHRDTELHFSPGINVLSGANGVGKSTIFEAIGYALFGVDAQKFVGNVERFITIGAKKGEIAVAFQLSDGQRFKVSRTVGAGAKWLLAREVGGIFEVEDHSGMPETEARLKQLLQLDNGRGLAEQFELVIGPFQNDFLGPFVIKQPTRRRDEFDAILGIDAWRKTYTETRVLANLIKAKVDVLEVEISSRQEQVDLLPERQSELDELVRGEELTRAQIAAKEQDLHAVEVRLTALDLREQEIRTLQADIRNLNTRVENGVQKIEEQQKRLGEAEQAGAVVVAHQAGKEAFDKAEARLALLRAQLAQQRQLENERAELDKRLSRLQARFDAESQALARAGAEFVAEEQRIKAHQQALQVTPEVVALAARLPEIREALSQLRTARGQIDGRTSGLQEGSEKLAAGTCPFFQEPCLNLAGKAPRDLFSTRLAALDLEQRRLAGEIEGLASEEQAAASAVDQVKQAQAKLEQLRQQLELLAERRKQHELRIAGLPALRAEQAPLQAQLGVKQQQLQAFAALQREIEQAEQEKQQHQQAQHLFVTHLKIAAGLAEHQALLARYVQLLGEIRGELEAKTSVLKAAEADYRPEIHAQERRQKEQLLGEIGTLGQKLADLGRNRARVAAEIERLRKLAQEIAAKKAQVRVYREKEELVQYLRNKVFKNVSAALGERFREEISLRADRIYRTIAETDEELLWGENYQIVLRDLVDGQIRERVNDQLSGGQTMSAVVALRLAMLQTIGARVAFFDEPTSNLDAARRENLARAFRSIDVGQEGVSEHWYDQLFLISHDVAFSEITDQIIHLGEGPSPAV